MDAELTGRPESDVIIRGLETGVPVGLGPYQRNQELFGAQGDSEWAGRPSAWSLIIT